MFCQNGCALQGAPSADDLGSCCFCTSVELCVRAQQRLSKLAPRWRVCHASRRLVGRPTCQPPQAKLDSLHAAMSDERPPDQW